MTKGGFDYHQDREGHENARDELDDKRTTKADPMTDLARLRSLAEKATKGPWTADEFAMEDDARVHIATTDGSPHYYHNSATIAECAVNFRGDPETDDLRPGEPQIGVIQAERNAAFIAACDPATILTLLSRVEKAEAGATLQQVYTDCMAVQYGKKVAEVRREAITEFYEMLKVSKAMADARPGALGNAQARIPLCEDCPHVGYPTDDTRCLQCPRRLPTPPASHQTEPGE